MITPEELKAIKEKTYREISLRKVTDDSVTVTVWLGENVKDRSIFTSLLKEMEKLALNETAVYQAKIDVSDEALPAARVCVPGMDPVTYINLDAGKMSEIVRSHIGERKPVAAYSANFSK